MSNLPHLTLIHNVFKLVHLFYPNFIIIFTLSAGGICLSHIWMEGLEDLCGRDRASEKEYFDKAVR